MLFWLLVLDASKLFSFQAQFWLVVDDVSNLFRFRHLGAVNTITFVDQNRRFVTTSDDKSIRVWEW